MEKRVIVNIRTLVGTLPSSSFKKGNEMAELSVIDDAFVEINDGIIVDYGQMKDCKITNDMEIIDANNKMVLPAFVDTHTHIVFAQTREGEFVDRIKGLTYEEIAEKGGGILNSARKLGAMSEDDLYEGAAHRVREMISYGTGAIEVKSGYGLSLESELKMLRVIKRLRKDFPILIKASFLGAHAIPLKYKDKRNEYINLVINEMLPQVDSEDLADYCDVFCDKGFFTVEETDRILKAADKYGMKPKIHANELGITGGVQVGIQNGAVSVDHLECIGVEEIEALKASETIPTVLPGCSFFLGIPYAPARRMIDEGLGIVIASDYNPGTAPSGKVPFLISLACIKMKLLPEEAINACTINAAYAIELQDKVGSITKGKLANIVITKSGFNLAKIPYSFGSDWIDAVLINGIVQ